MSLLNYFKVVPFSPNLPDPCGSLSRDYGIPARAITSANREVERAIRRQSQASQPKRRGSYYKYTEKQRAQVSSSKL